MSACGGLSAWFGRGSKLKFALARKCSFWRPGKRSRDAALPPKWPSCRVLIPWFGIAVGSNTLVRH